VGKNTIFRYLRMETLPERKRRTERGCTLLTPYHTYLLARWNAGCRDALQHFRELQARGYPGSYATVACYVQRLRHAHGRIPPPRRCCQPPPPVVTAPRHRPLTPRRAT
jgi:transposase